MKDLLLTVFTPTYNRAYILPKVYKSLKSQQKGDYSFEWLIIDDDSSDKTEDLVKEWMKEDNDFNIRYVKQKHGGKHRALNKAFDLAKGSFFFIVDSDDSITENAMLLISNWVSKIKDNFKYAGVSGLRISEKGKIWGGNVDFKEDFVDATDFERRKYNLLGDKAEVYRTDLLKKYKFPEIDNEYFVTEDYCWMQIAADGLKIRWYNKPIYVCEYLEDGLTNNGANLIEGHKKNFKGYCLYIQKCLELKPFCDKMLHFKEYNNTMKCLNYSFFSRCKYIKFSKLKYLVFFFLGVPIGFLIRKIRYRK